VSDTPHAALPAGMPAGCDTAPHVLAGTGSRQLQAVDNAAKKVAAELVTNEVIQRRDRYGDRLVVMSGMAEGFDKLLALTALRTGVKLWCAIPNRGYGAYYWGPAQSLTGTDQRAQFTAIVARAWRVTYVMEDVHRTQGLYLNGKHSNFIRNDYMVAQADEFLVWDPGSRGTQQCFATIRAAGRQYTLLSAPGESAPGE
jgi:hypothetical protein